MTRVAVALALLGAAAVITAIGLLSRWEWALFAAGAGLLYLGLFALRVDDDETLASVETVKGDNVWPPRAAGLTPRRGEGARQ